MPQNSSWLASLVLPAASGTEAEGTALCQVVSVSVSPLCCAPDRIYVNALPLVDEVNRAVAQACWWAEQVTHRLNAVSFLTRALFTCLPVYPGGSTVIHRWVSWSFPWFKLARGSAGIAQHPSSPLWKHSSTIKNGQSVRAQNTLRHPLGPPKSCALLST